MRICPQCHTELPEQANFCFSCGYKLTAKPVRSQQVKEEQKKLGPTFQSTEKLAEKQAGVKNSPEEKASQLVEVGAHELTAFSSRGTGSPKRSGSSTEKGISAEFKREDSERAKSVSQRKKKKQQDRSTKRIAEQPEGEFGPTTEARKKVAIVTAVAVVTVFALVLSSIILTLLDRKKEKTPYVLTKSGRELQITNVLTEKTLVLETHIAAGAAPDWFYQELADQSGLTYGAGGDEDNYRLSMVRYGRFFSGESRPDVLDEHVSGRFYLDAEGNVFYRTTEGQLYRYKEGSKEQLADGVEEFLLSPNKGYIAFKTEEGFFGLRPAANAREQAMPALKSGGDYLLWVSDSGESFYTADEKTIWRHRKGKEAEEIVKNHAFFQPVTDGGAFYFTVDKEETIPLLDTVTDRYKDDDAKLLPPAFQKDDYQDKETPLNKFGRPEQTDEMEISDSTKITGDHTEITNVGENESFAEENLIKQSTGLRHTSRTGETVGPAGARSPERSGPDTGLFSFIKTAGDKRLTTSTSVQPEPLSTGSLVDGGAEDKGRSTGPGPREKVKPGLTGAGSRERQSADSEGNRGEKQDLERQLREADRYLQKLERDRRRQLLEKQIVRLRRSELWFYDGQEARRIDSGLGQVIAISPDGRAIIYNIVGNLGTGQSDISELDDISAYRERLEKDNERGYKLAADGVPSTLLPAGPLESPCFGQDNREITYVYGEDRTLMNTYLENKVVFDTLTLARNISSIEPKTPEGRQLYYKDNSTGGRDLYENGEKLLTDVRQATATQTDILAIVAEGDQQKLLRETPNRDTYILSETVKSAQITSGYAVVFTQLDGDQYELCYSSGGSKVKKLASFQEPAEIIAPLVMNQKMKTVFSLPFPLD